MAPRDAASSRNPAQLVDIPHFDSFCALDPKNGAETLKGLVALGMYIQAEGQWVQGLGRHPTEQELFDFHNRGKMLHELERVRKEADSEVGADLISSHQKEELCKVVADSIAQHHAPSFSWYGVLEAMCGAFFYSLLLIGLGLILRHLGVDAIEALKTATGHS